MSVCPCLSRHNNCYVHRCHATTLVDMTATSQFEYSAGAATMSSQAQLQVWHTKEQRQCRREADREQKDQSNQLLVILTEQLTDRECLPGEHLNGLECSRRPCWFLDMKYHTSFIWRSHLAIASFPGLAQLFVACSTEKRGESLVSFLTWAWRNRQMARKFRTKNWSFMCCSTNYKFNAWCV